VTSEDTNSILPWPTEEGIWMGWLEDCWFPLKAVELKGDLEDMKKSIPTEHFTLGIVVQFPMSDESWPFTFKQCHPVEKWRRPTEDELRRARAFYEIPEGYKI